jgi:hypothetical protein
MKTLKISLAIALIFVAGFVAGSVTTRAVTRRAVARILKDPGQLRLLVGNRLDHRLRLDAEQRQKVDTILSQTQGDLTNLRHQFAPSLHGIMSNTEFQISAILTSEQKARFERFKEEHRTLWQR